MQALKQKHNKISKQHVKNLWSISAVQTPGFLPPASGKMTPAPSKNPVPANLNKIQKSFVSL